VHGHAAQDELLAQCVAEPPGDLEPGVSALATADEHGELVAAEPRKQVLAAHLLGEARRDLAQQVVAALVAQDVVDLLEAVEVDQQQRELLTGRDG
jgi:hypothetical protein